MRHEALNEAGSEKVIADVIAWINGSIGR